MVRHVCFLSLLLICSLPLSLRAQDTAGTGSVGLLDQTATDPAYGQGTGQGSPFQNDGQKGGGLSAISGANGNGGGGSGIVPQAVPVAQIGPPALHQSVSPAVGAIDRNLFRTLSRDLEASAAGGDKIYPENPAGILLGQYRGLGYETKLPLWSMIEIKNRKGKPYTHMQPNMVEAATEGFLTNGAGFDKRPPISEYERLFERTGKFEGPEWYNGWRAPESNWKVNDYGQKVADHAWKNFYPATQHMPTPFLAQYNATRDAEEKLRHTQFKGDDGDERRFLDATEGVGHQSMGEAVRLAKLFLGDKDETIAKLQKAKSTYERVKVNKAFDAHEGIEHFVAYNDSRRKQPQVFDAWHDYNNPKEARGTLPTERQTYWNQTFKDAAEARDWMRSLKEAGFLDREISPLLVDRVRAMQQQATRGHP